MPSTRTLAGAGSERARAAGRRWRRRNGSADFASHLSLRTPSGRLSRSLVAGARRRRHCSLIYGLAGAMWVTLTLTLTFTSPFVGPQTNAAESNLGAADPSSRRPARVASRAGRPFVGTNDDDDDAARGSRPRYSADGQLLEPRTGGGQSNGRPDGAAPVTSSWVGGDASGQRLAAARRPD